MAEIEAQGAGQVRHGGCLCGAVRYPVVDGSFATILTLREVVADAPLPGGADRLADVIDDARLMAAAEMLGQAQQLFDETLNYVKTREQFGQPLGRFQVIQHNMVGGYEKVELMQSALYRALLVPGQSRLPGRSPCQRP